MKNAQKTLECSSLVTAISCCLFMLHDASLHIYFEVLASKYIFPQHKPGVAEKKEQVTIRGGQIRENTWKFDVFCTISLHYGTLYSVFSTRVRVY